MHPRLAKHRPSALRIRRRCREHRCPSHPWYAEFGPGLGAKERAAGAASDASLPAGAQRASPPFRDEGRIELSKTIAPRPRRPGGRGLGPRGIKFTRLQLTCQYVYYTDFWSAAAALARSPWPAGRCGGRCRPKSRKKSFCDGLVWSIRPGP